MGGSKPDNYWGRKNMNVPLLSVAVIFDNQARPDTTGVYCRRALGQLCRVEHFLPGELGRIPRQGFDLYVNIDDGLEYRLPADLRPAALWAIDTHLNLPWYLTKAADFDFVFAAQRDGAARLRQAGIEAHWLPLAADPELHTANPVAKRFDVCFVGNVFPGPRAELVELLQQHYPNHFVGQRYFVEMAETYAGSRIVFNRSLRDDINMRVFEALASGSLLLTNALPGSGQEELFQDGVHLATYQDAEELLCLVRYYLEHEEERERIAAAGKAEVLGRHTYRHRIAAVLEQVERRLSEATRPDKPGNVNVQYPTRNFQEKGERQDSEAVDFGLTSIIILTHNQLDYTRLCVESIQRYTPELHELIFVDNASSDGTLEYLECLPDVKVIRNAENRGFPAGANQGIRAATGRQVLLLNNDTVVTPGWLGRQLRTLHSDERIGLVGPCSNFVSGQQQVPARYGDLAGLDEFARAWGRDHDRVVEVTDRLVGFCLLIRREVIDQVGFLDERFGLGCFEDDDYTRRALVAGFRAVIARNAFIHHFGGRTFVGSGVDFKALMERNQQLFLDKWASRSQAPPGNALPGGSASPSERLSNSRPVNREAEPPASAFPGGAWERGRLSLQRHGGGLLLKRPRPDLSLCMIVRDNARTIEACLSSIRPWVDEMVVVDTGSTDQTPAMAQRLGARVHHFLWCDSFAAARNESLRHARGRWIFWMDSDDTIDPENGVKLRRLARQGADQAIMGYVIQVHCPGPDRDGAAQVTVVDQVKLFRNLPCLRFERRIHEQIIPAIRRAGGEIAWSDIFVVHSGYDHGAEAQARKRQRDLHLLHLELAEEPEHPFTLFNLGMTHGDAGSHEEAVGYLRRSLTHSGPGESHLRKVYGLLVHSLQELGRQEEAWQVCAEGLRQFPEDAELLFRKAGLLHAKGKLAEAVQGYEELFQASEGRHFGSVVRGLQGHLGRHNLALTLGQMGKHRAAEEQWRLAVKDAPGYEPGWLGLAESLRRQGKVAEANQAVKRPAH
jgi:GT2 family glycosyltransferase/tetratricopeptide (TPR) repeat protein